MKSIIKLFCLIGLLCSGTSYALLDLELTQGVQGSIPIAVVPFSGQSASDSSPNNITKVITADLQNSGRFNVANAGEMREFPNSASQVNFPYWQSKNLNNLVIGTVKPAGGGRYQVEFQLLNAYPNKNQASKSSSAPAWQSAILLSKTFTVDGSALRNLAHHISDLVYQYLTGDKGVFATRIAYVVAQQSTHGSQYTLEVADMDGYNPKPLLRSNQPIMSPTWSPDARHLAYVSFESNRPIVYVQDVNSGSRHVLSDSPGLNSAPAWSPDGRKLAVVLTRTGYPKIFVMDLGSRHFTQATQGDSIDTEPTWTPDGRSLLFTSNRGGAPQIYRVNLGSAESRRVTFEGNYNASSSLSPDGKALAVLSGGNNRFNIAVQDLASGRYTTLTQSGSDQSPSIAPNGKMVLYATQLGGRGVLGMVSTDGKVKLTLPSRDGDVREPAWSPFLN